MPDRAMLTVQIQTDAVTASDSALKNAQITKRIFESARARLSGKGVVETGSFSVQAQFGRTPERHQPPQQIIVSYTTYNSVTIQTDSLDSIGALIDDAIKAGATQIGSLTYMVRDNSAIREAALTRAAEDAQSKARVIARTMGVKIKQLVKVSTDQENVPVLQHGISTALGPEATLITPGQLTAWATITAIYQIE